MRLGLYIGLLVIAMFLQLMSQNIPPEWKYIRPTNTGIPGTQVQLIKIDAEGNKWTAAFEPFWAEGGVAMFDNTIWYNWSNFETPLPSERVGDIDFDQSGNRWFATDNGLAMTDGVNWTIYNTSNTPLESNHIRDVLVDHNNIIWVSYQEPNTSIGGIGKFDGATWTIYTPTNSNLPTYRVGVLDADQQNNIWIGTSTHGVIKFDGLNWIQYNANNSGLPCNGVSDIKVDHRNWKWFVCSGGIARLSGNNDWVVYDDQNTPIPSTTYLRSIDIRGNEIIVGSLDCFAAHFDGNTWTIHPSTGWVIDVAFDSSGNMWAAGTDFLSVYDGSSWTDYNNYNTGLPEYFISHIYADPWDNLWFSGGNGGVAKFDGFIWTCYGKFNRGLHPWPFPYTSIGSGAVVDANGYVWIGADGVEGGVARWVNNSWEVWESANAGVPLQGVQILGADSSGKLWVGTKFVGLSVYDGTNWTHYNTSNSQLPGNNVKCFYAEPNGAMWVGTNLGAVHILNGIWTVYDMNSGLPGFKVNAIARDSQGNTWFAQEVGLVRFDGSNWTLYNEANSGIVADYISDLLVDHNDIVWASGYNILNYPYYGGVSRFDGQTWINFTPSNSPLPHHQVERLALDSRGNLWISPTSEGVAVYNPEGVIITGIDDGKEQIFTEIPTEFSLQQNYPNPFNPTTTIQFALNKPARVILRVFDTLGREVATLINDRKNAGVYHLVFDGRHLSSGVYMYQLKTDHFVETRKMLLLK